MPATKKKFPWVKVFLIFLGGLVLIAIIASFFSSGPSITDKISICTYSEMNIVEALKSPSTAEFQPCYYGNYRTGNDNDFYYSSYVDSQNSFGVVVRTKFTCKVWNVDYNEKEYNIKCTLD